MDAKWGGYGYIMLRTETLNRKDVPENMPAKTDRKNTDPAVKRFTGCLLAGALGDAMGWPVEFESIDAIHSKYGNRGIQQPETNSDGVWEITDDTQMTLFTAEGCLQAWTAARHFGPPPDFTKHLHNAYLRWLNTQGEGGIDNGGWLLGEKQLYSRRAPGGTCISALSSGRAGSINNPINNSKGCGGIMRTAPAGLIAARIVDGGDEDIARFAFELGSLAAAITHSDPSGYLPAGYLAALISSLCRGIGLEPAITIAGRILKAQNGAEETVTAVEKALTIYKDNTFEPSPEVIESLGGGWTGEEALSISLYCSLVGRDNIHSALRLSVNHSGDSDSTGSITGNILGAIHGEDALSKEWLKQLELSQVIRRTAEDLFSGFRGTHDWILKYLPKPV